MRATLLGMAILLAATRSGAGVKSPLDALADPPPRKPAALVALGALYVEAMRLDDARRVYKEALDRSEDFAEAKAGLARIQMAEGTFRQAKAACKKIADAHKKESVGEICSGWFWLSNDRSARAVEEFEKAIKKGDLSNGKTGIGEVLRRQSDYDGSVAAFEEAIRAGAGYVAKVGLGLTLELMQKREAAVQAFEKAVAAEPASCLAHYHYGRMLQKGDRAIQELETALAIRSEWPEAWLALGDAYADAGKYDQAQAAYRNAIKGDERLGGAYLGLGRALHKTGQDKEAVEALEKAAALIPDLLEAYRLLAEIHYALNQYDEALAALEKMRNLAPEDAAVHLLCGTLSYKMQRFTPAKAFLEQAVAMKPSLSLAHLLLGDIHCQRRLYRIGQDHYKQALEGDMVDVNKADIEKRQADCQLKP